MGLGADIKTAIDALVGADKYDRTKIMDAMGDTIEDYHAGEVEQTAVTIWDSAVTYLISTYVVYNNHIWKSLQGSNLNHTPAKESTWWRRILLPESSGQLNDIINGGFRIWQEALTHTSVASGTYTADMWRYFKSATSTVVHDISRDGTVVPNDQTFTSLKMEVTTADASAGAAEACDITYLMEGIDFKKYVGRTATLSFWVRDAVTGAHSVAFRNGGVDRSYVVEYTIDVADTWELKAVQVKFDYSSGTWDYTTGSTGLRITFPLMVGSNFQTTAGSWQTGNYIGTSSTVNSIGTIGNTFYLANVKMELGSVATDYIEVPYEIELSRCQRFLEKSWNTNTTIGASTAVGSITTRGNGTFTALYDMRVDLKVKKPYIPVVTWYSTDGTKDRVFHVNAAANRTVTSENHEGEGSTGYPILSVNTVNGDRYRAHFVADSRLS